MSVAVTIFSKDRACQLDALLSSLRQHLRLNGEQITPTVLWTASNDGFAAGYHKLFNRFALSVRFVKEHKFNDDALALLPKTGFWLPFVDDDVIHSPVDLAVPMREMEENEELVAVSLRLGLNTVRCYPLDADQRVPSDAYVNHRGLMTWHWSAGEHDMGYPFSLDAHLLRADDVRQLLHGSVSHNPNQIEQTLASRAWMRSAMRPKMASYARSCVTGVPANVVTTTHNNRHASLYSPELLNQWYLDGARISWRHMNWGCVDAAHVALNYVFDPIAKAA